MVEFYKNLLVKMGYNPVESYKAIMKFQLAQAKYWELGKLKVEQEDVNKRFEEIKIVVSKPDSLKNKEELYLDEYSLKDIQEQKQSLENKIKVRELQFRLDTLENTGQGYSREAENIRKSIDFEERYQHFLYVENKGDYFLKDLQYTSEDAKTYLNKQKNLTKLSPKSRKKSKEKLERKSL